jgi:WD40 repeat protein
VNESLPTPNGQVPARPNPYIGPRAFRTGEALFGRDVEVANLLDLLIARRIVLLYSPSGAGKTSLIHAGLRPRLAEEGFYVHPVLRVAFDAASLPELTSLAKLPGYNRFIFSVLYSLESQFPAGERLPAGELVGLTLAEYLEARRLPPAATRDSEALIFDQFEEILTIDPTQRQEKQVFFQQLGIALQKHNRWALFAIREDYLAALDPYLLYIPTRFANSFRLDLLSIDAARQAVREPARLNGVDFTAEAADKLLDDLCKVQVTLPDGSTEVRPGPYVEPLQLQVVCYNLWEKLDPQDREITADRLEAIGSVEASLEDYYASKVQVIAGYPEGSPPSASSAERQERLVREWFEYKLITPRGQRNRVLMEPEQSGGLPNHLILKLLDTHLVRGEQHGGLTWFELAHDRLVRPVRQNNAAWFEAHLAVLQRQAALWEKQARPDDLLLRGDALKEGVTWAAAHPDELLEAEQQFLKESQHLAEEEERQRREQEQRLLDEQRNATRFRRLSVVIGLIAFIALTAFVVAFLLYQKSQSSEAEAKNQRTIAVTAQANAENQKATAVTAQAIAERKAREARAGQYAAQSQLTLDRYPQRSLLLALEAVNVSKQSNETPIPAAEQALLAALTNAGGLGLGGHKDQINDLAFSPDDRWLASASSDSTIRLWDLAAANPATDPITLTGHTDRVNTLAFSPDGRWLASGGKDVRLWNLPAADPSASPIILTAAPTTNLIWYLDFGQGGDRVVAKDEDGTVFLWDGVFSKNPTNHPPLGVLNKFPESISLSADRRWLAGANPQGGVWLWDLSQPDPAAEVRVLREKGDQIYALDFSPDGRYLAAASEKGDLWLLDLEASDPFAGAHWADPQKKSMRPAVFSFEGDRLATLSEGGIIRVWDVKDGALSDNPLSLPWDEAYPDTLNFSPDSRWLAAGGTKGAVQLWDLQNPDSQPPISLRGHDAQVNALAFSPGGDWLATGGTDTMVRLWNLAPVRPQDQPLALKTQGGQIWSAAFSPDSHWLAIGSEDGTARVLGLEIPNPVSATLSMPGHKKAVLTIAISPKGRWLITGSLDGTARLWDLASPDPVSHSFVLSGQDKWVAGAVFTGDERWLVTLSSDTIPRLWDLNAEDPSANPLHLGGENAIIKAAAISSDGQRLAAVKPDGTWQVWDLSAPDPSANPLTWSSPDLDIAAVSISPKGRWVIAGLTDGSARLWNLETPSADPLILKLAGVVEPPSPGKYYGFFFSPDGNWLASTDNDKTLQLWNLNTPELNSNPDSTRQVLRGHEKLITQVVFSNDGAWLFTSSADGIVRRWSLKSANPAVTPFIFDSKSSMMGSLALSPDGRWLVTGNKDGGLRVWDLDLDGLINIACRTTGRNLYTKEWEQYFPGENYRTTCPNLPAGQ